MLLETVGIPIAQVAPPDIPEQIRAGEGPVAYAVRLAGEKARAVPLDDRDTWVLAADTVVHVDDVVFEKPRDATDAARILRRLAGRWHEVTTAWCLRGTRTFEGHRTSRVRFRELGVAEIASYVATGEGADKAGAYGIQGRGGALVDEVLGSCSAVIGLPMADVVGALARIGVIPLETK
jgi:Nucleotide-binding protein implicated in inhibition of septum formation